MDYLIASIGGYYCYRGQSHHDQVMDNIAEESDRLMTLFQTADYYGVTSQDVFFLRCVSWN